MTEDWQELDHDHVERLLAGFTPSPVPSANWRGVFPPNRIPPVKANDPVGSTQEPLMFLLWRLVYDEELEDTYGQTPPYRTGKLEVSVYSELGSGDAKAAGVGGIAKQVKALLAADSARLIWMVNLAKPQRSGQQRGTFFWVSGLDVPFAGG